MPIKKSPIPDFHLINILRVGIFKNFDYIVDHESEQQRVAYQ